MYRSPSIQTPLQILHAVGGMDAGGVETWLMHVMRHCDRSRFQFDFLVHSDRRYANSDEIEALGGRLIPCREPRRMLTYARNFSQLVADHGPYDVVHSHMNHFNGIVLRLAAKAGIATRITHSHNNDLVLRADARMARRFYVRLMGHWIRRYATVGLACSPGAAVAQFGPHWQADPRWSVHKYGIDLAPFCAPVEVDAVRAEMNIPPGALVVGNVARLVWQKNHAKTLEVAAALARRRRDFRLLLVGDGPLRGQIEGRIRTLDLERNCILTGSRGDVPRLLKAMDVFLFPSRHEGLGLALVEAQAADVPSVSSDQVPLEADVVPGMVERLSLSAGAEAWADAVLDAVARKAAARRAGASPRAALAAVQRSPFNVAREVLELERFYQESRVEAFAA